MTLFRKKPVQIAMALVVATGIILAGTFAWFNFSQTALNEFKGFVNPDVNLHDDFWEPNKDVYVENSGSKPLYVRVKLDEYMDVNGATLVPGGIKDSMITWSPHNYAGGTVLDCNQQFHTYYEWTVGGQKWYLPAPPEKRSSVDADGKPVEPKVVIGKNTKDETKLTPEEKRINYGRFLETLDADLTSDAAGSFKTLVAAMDAADKALKENKDPTKTQGLKDALAVAQAAVDKLILDKKYGYTFDKLIVDVNGNKPGDAGYVATYELITDANGVAPGGANYVETHAQTFVGIKRTQQTVAVLTMDEWTAGRDTTNVNSPNYRAPFAIGNFWVLDKDGWAYWANELPAATATGQLLDNVGLLKTPDGDWYYGINAQLQAATKDDIVSFGTSGGGITPDAMKLFDLATGDFVYTGAVKYFNNKDNTFRLVTTTGTQVTYGPIFSAGVDKIPGNADDASIAKGQTKTIVTNGTSIAYTIADIVDGVNGKRYIEMTYPADKKAYLAAGTDKLLGTTDDVLTWAGTNGIGSPNDSITGEVTAAAKTYEIGESFTMDGLDWIVIGKDTTKGTLVVSKSVLDYGQKFDADATADTTYIASDLKTFIGANYGSAQLTELAALDGTIAPTILDKKMANDYFANNAARVAYRNDKPGENARWWLADDATFADGKLTASCIGTGGSVVSADGTAATDVGIRVAIWVKFPTTATP